MSWRDNGRRNKVLMVIGLMVLYIVLIGLIGLQWANAHEVDERYTPGDDSVKVQLEIDADLDGTWEVRHVFFDKAGVWLNTPLGELRVSRTLFGAGTDTTHTRRYTFWLEDNTHEMWRKLKLDTLIVDSASVLLPEFGQFGMSYGDTLLVDPATSMKIFQSPDWVWTLTPRTVDDQ